MTENQKNNINQNSRIWTGIFLVATGGLLLASKAGVELPHWLLSWETFLIALGLLIGVKSNFKNPASIILLLIGTASLTDNYYPDLNIRAYVWPAAIILLGLFFIIRPKKFKHNNQWPKKYDLQNSQWQNDSQNVLENVTTSGEEIVDITATFGGVKKIILSKNFKGGDITAFMGGAEIDLTQADIINTAVLDVSAVFGGVKLIIPANWDIQNKATAIFGGVDDKRTMHTALDKNKTLIIDGAAVFGGIEIKSY